MLFENVPERTSFVYETFFEYVAGQALARDFENSTEREGILKRVEELSDAYRWRQVPLYLTELVSEPDAIVERLRLPNIWLAAQAMRRASSRVLPRIRQQLITDLEEKLKSKFALDRQRAADLLGLLNASESKDQLLQYWATCKPNSYEARAVLRALARLDVEDIVEPFMRYLGRYLDWYIPDDQELIDTLPANFRQQLLHTAVTLLQDAEYMEAAAHTIGYLKAEQAVVSLHSHLEATEWRNWVALLALVHIETKEAFNTLEVALSEIGERISAHDQQLSNYERSYRCSKGSSSNT